MTTIQDAVADLYRIAIVDKKPTSTKRLGTLARYCGEQLTARGVVGSKPETAVEGSGRTKNWDVGLKVGENFRLGVSLKSMLQNLAGSVPNRIDDLQGEVLSAQSRFANVVIGYIILMDTAKDYESKKHGMSWIAKMRQDVTRMSSRTTNNLQLGLVEASAVVEVDFSEGPRLVSSEAALGRFFETLALEYKLRWPAG